MTIQTYHSQPNNEVLNKTQNSFCNNSSVSCPSQTIVKAKLEMSEPSNHDEIEADNAANEIINGGKISRKISDGNCSSGVRVSTAMENQLSHMQGGGHSMPSGLQSMMESGFGRDFSQVRLHTDSQAAEMSSSINAKAFTLGNDIYFNKGQYNPSTTEGQRLMAHELAHVAQGNKKISREEEDKPFISRQTLLESIVLNEIKGKRLVMCREILRHKLRMNEYGVGAEQEIKAIINAYEYAQSKFFTKNNFKRYLNGNHSSILSEETVDEIATIVYDHFDTDEHAMAYYLKFMQDQLDSYDKSSSNSRINDAVAFSNNPEKYNLINNFGALNKLTAVALADKVQNSAYYFKTPNSLISGKTWTEIFLSELEFIALVFGGAVAKPVKTVIDLIINYLRFLNNNKYADKKGKKSGWEFLITSIINVMLDLVPEYTIKSEVKKSIAGDISKEIFNQIMEYYEKGDKYELNAFDLIVFIIKTIVNAIIAYFNANKNIDILKELGFGKDQIELVVNTLKDTFYFVFDKSVEFHD